MAALLTPDKLAKSGSEHGEQRAFFAWLFANNRAVWELTFAIPNGGYRDKITAGKLKAEGVKAGVPDIMVAWPITHERDAQMLIEGRKPYAGLFIEMKRAAGKKGAAGRVAAETQSPWHAALEARGYAVAVAYTWRQAAEVVLSYFGVPKDRQAPIIEAWPSGIES